MPLSRPSVRASSRHSDTVLAAPTVATPAAGHAGRQPCLRCGALLDIAAFAISTRVRCGACRAVNVAGEPPPERPDRSRHGSHSTIEGDDPLERIFHGADGETAQLPRIDHSQRGNTSDTVDLQLLAKFQPALAGLAPTDSNSPASDGAAGIPAQRWSDQLEECQLGAYKILRRIATGGMGTVYEAEHIALHRKVAVKILHRDIAGSVEIQERIQREALTLARIRHQHIVEIFDIGNFEGRPFLVMEFIAGGDLKTLLATRTMEEREALRIAAEIAEAVDFAHQRGIIHRDLKPANILLDEAQSVKAADFGLAKVIGASTQLTATGTTVGTPAYMAPEQARGQVDQLDARADVYSIGAILYETLTAHPPFAGAHLMDVLYKVVHERPAHPQKLNPKISTDAATICLKAMAQSSADRYESAWALMSDLEALLHGESILARPPSPMMLLWRNIKKFAAIWAMAVVLVLGIGFEAGRYVVGAYRNHAAQLKLEDIRTAALTAAVDAQGQPTSRLDRYRNAIAAADRLYKKTALQDAQDYRQELEKELQQWLTVDRLKADLAQAEQWMNNGKYTDADLQLRLIQQADPGPASSEAFGEIEALQTAARLRSGQLIELRESRELAMLTAKFNDAQHQLTAGDFAGAEELLRGLLIQIPADLQLYTAPQVRAAMANLRAETTTALQVTSKHREDQIAAKLQKDLANQLDPFKGIPGISELVTSWLSDGNGAQPDGALQLPLPDPTLATPPGFEPPPGLRPPATPPDPNLPPSVSDLFKVILPGVTAPQPKPPPEQTPAPQLPPQKPVAPDPPAR